MQQKLSVNLFVTRTEWKQKASKSFPVVVEMMVSPNSELVGEKLLVVDHCYADNGQFLRTLKEKGSKANINALFITYDLIDAYGNSRALPVDGLSTTVHKTIEGDTFVKAEIDADLVRNASTLRICAHFAKRGVFSASSNEVEVHVTDPVHIHDPVTGRDN